MGFEPILSDSKSGVLFRYTMGTFWENCFDAGGVGKKMISSDIDVQK
jgi:hypothetical protein